MTEVREYMPGFVDPVHIERAVGDADNLEELLALPFIKKWTDMPDFLSFRVSYEPPDHYTLVADLKNGHYWVAAFMAQDYGITREIPPTAQTPEGRPLREVMAEEEAARQRWKELEGKPRRRKNRDRRKAAQRKRQKAARRTRRYRG